MSGTKWSHERSEPGGHVLREVLQHEVERDEHRRLREQRQAGGRRVDLVLLVEGHHRLVLLGAIALVLPLDLLHLRRVLLERLHRVDLLHGQRDEQDPDADRGADDRPGPGDAEVVVELVEHPANRVLERLEDAEDEEGGADHGWSTPPCDHGLQRSKAPRGLARIPSRARACGAPRSRTPSSSGGTCRCPPGRAGRTSSGRGRRGRRRPRPGCERSRARVMPRAFPSTSSTRSPSHSKPRVSAASGSPGRTTST